MPSLYLLPYPFIGLVLLPGSNYRQFFPGGDRYYFFASIDLANPSPDLWGEKYLYALVRQTEIHAVKSPSHHKPFYFYFLIYPVITLPWSLVILIGVVKGFLHRYSFPQLFLATSLTAIMLFFRQSLLNFRYIYCLFTPLLLF